MKKALVMLTAAAAIAVPATMAGASSAVRLVYVSSTGSCDANYIEVVQAGNSAVCVYRANPPAFRVTTNGCGAGETPYLVLNRYGVCTTP